MYKINAPHILNAVTPDGLVGFDRFGQLMAWTAKDEDGYQTGNIIHDVRDCTCYICGNGWELSSVSLKDQMHDNNEHLMHRTCYDGVQKMMAYGDIQESLILAGYLFTATEVPPRYPHSTPWQVIAVRGADNNRTDTGWRVVLGRRKRVWEIRMHNVTQTKGEEVFKDVTDTHGWCMTSQDEPQFGPYYFVHAYTTEQMVDYLTRFRKLIPYETDRNNAQ